MVNCFRGVPYKLCCTNYFKTTNIVHSDTKFGLRKITHTPSENRIGLMTQNENLVAECKSPYVKTTNHKKDRSLPTLYSKSPQHRLVVRPYQGNVIDILKSSIPTRQSTYVLNISSNDDPEKSKLQCTQGRPSEEQLDRMFKNLSKHLPKIMVEPLPVTDYHPKVILENNFKNKRTVGLIKYVSQLALVKMVAYFKFAYVGFKILKITKHPEDGTIKVRWRIIGVPGMSVIFQFWKFGPTTWQKRCDEAPTWIDGFSIYYVGDDGRIFKHILDRMQPNDDIIEAKPKSTIAPKVTLFVSLLRDHEKAKTFVSRAPKQYVSNLSR